MQAAIWLDGKRLREGHAIGLRRAAPGLFVSDPFLEWKMSCETIDAVAYFAEVMTITLPDHPALTALSPAALRLELACALYANSRASSLVAAEIAGVSYDEFLDALRERYIPRYTVDMLREDITNFNRLFPDDPLPLPSR